jgi:uncharacterized small protein (DUF1192 family)
MGCWHGCAPWHGSPYRHGWYVDPRWDPYAYEDELPMVRRGRRGGRDADRAITAETLEARVDDLRDEIERLQATLAKLRADAGVQRTEEERPAHG